MSDDRRRLNYKFAAIPDWILEHDELDGSAVRVFGLMAKFRKPYLSLGALAEVCRCSEDTIRRSIRKLEAVGALKVIPRHDHDGRQTSNAYELAGEAPLADLPPTPLAPTRGQSKTTKELDVDQNQNPSRDLVLLATPPFPVITAADYNESLFEDFWTVYPRRVGKPNARKAFARALPKTTVAAMADGLRGWCAWWSARGDPEFIPHPATWLNQERWNDQPPAAPHTETSEERFNRLFGNGDQQ